VLKGTVLYQLGWTTLPGLRGLSVSDFRAVPTENPDTQSGVAAEFPDDASCSDTWSARRISTRRFSNGADAFDSESICWIGAEMNPRFQVISQVVNNEG
jgi:hypothetical protein